MHGIQTSHSHACKWISSNWNLEFSTVRLNYDHITWLFLFLLHTARWIPSLHNRVIHYQFFFPDWPELNLYGITIPTNFTLELTGYFHASPIKSYTFILGVHLQVGEAKNCCGSVLDSVCSPSSLFFKPEWPQPICSATPWITFYTIKTVQFHIVGNGKLNWTSYNQVETR